MIATVVNPRRAPNSKRRKKSETIGSFFQDVGIPRPPSYMMEDEDFWQDYWDTYFPSQDKVLSDVEAAITSRKGETNVSDQ